MEEKYNKILELEKKKLQVLKRTGVKLKNLRKKIMQKGEPYVISPAHQPSLKQGKKMKTTMRQDAKNKKLGPDMSRGTVKRKTNKKLRK